MLWWRGAAGGGGGVGMGGGSSGSKRARSLPSLRLSSSGGREEEAGQGARPLHSNGGQCRSPGYYRPGLHVLLKGGDESLIIRGT